MTLDSGGRHLADIGGDDRVPPVRDRGDPHRHVVFLERDVAVRFAERRFGLAVLGVDQPSMTISASAGTSRSTVFALTTLIGAPASPPATVNSSTPTGSFCGPMNAT